MFYNRRFYSIVLVVLAIASCKPESIWTTINISESERKIPVEKSYYTLDSHLPINLSVKDSIIFLNFARSTYALAALNINTQTVIDTFGNIGRGPNDVISPEFIQQVDKKDIILSDGNSKRIINITSDNSNKRHTLKDFLDYPEEIYPASDISLSENFISGRTLRSEGSMFFIYNRNNKEIKEIPFDPPIQHLESRKNYFYAARTAINEHANRVIAANYFFNMFHVYTLDGSRLATVAMSEEPIPTVDRNTRELNISHEYTGAQGLFATNNHLYILTKTKNSDHPDTRVIQINWDGRLINSFQIDETLIGGFFIDESEKRMYAITHSVNNKGNEIFEVVSYLF